MTFIIFEDLEITGINEEIRKINATISRTSGIDIYTELPNKENLRMINYLRARKQHLENIKRDNIIDIACI